MILDKYEKAGKVATHTAEETNKLFEVTYERMRKVRAEVSRLEFVSRMVAEKIIICFK